MENKTKQNAWAPDWLNGTYCNWNLGRAAVKVIPRGSFPQFVDGLSDLFLMDRIRW